MWRSFLLVVALASLTACTTLSNTARSYRTASNGLQIDDDRVRYLLQRGMADSALRAVGNRKSTLSPDDRLLRLLYQATSARYAGRHREAGLLFDQAFAVSEDRYTKSISRMATAMLTNDFALPYTAGRNERLLLHYNALLAWSAGGDVEAAAVEARRLVALLASAGDPDEGERPMRAMLHSVAAAAFEQAREWSDADVARRNAIRLGASLDSVWAPPADSLGDVIVVIERGDVAHKVAVGLTIPIFNGENPQANNGSAAAQRMLADFGALRNGGLWWDDAQSWRFTEARSGAWRGAQASYLLDMSWPVLRQSRASTLGSVEVLAGSTRAEGALNDVSLNDAIAADYRRDRGAIMSRTVSRAVAKYLAARAVEAAVESAAKNGDSGDKKKKKKRAEQKQVAGFLARAFVNGATTALERADTRAWTLLPASVSVLRLRIPAGSHELFVNAAGTRQLSLPAVVVRAGQTTVVSARLWREPGEGIRSMIERTAASHAAPER